MSDKKQSYADTVKKGPTFVSPPPKTTTPPEKKANKKKTIFKCRICQEEFDSNFIPISNRNEDNLHEECYEFVSKFSNHGLIPLDSVVKFELVPKHTLTKSTRLQDIYDLRVYNDVGGSITFSLY